jgi:hypothetical protein
MVILSAGVGALAGIVTTAWKSRKDLEAEYDIDLRKRRIEAYAELWKTLEPLAYYFEPSPVTYESVRKLGRALRGWYFRTGGLVLSSDTRPAYFNLQQALEGVRAAPAEASQQLDEPRLKILKALASRLRTSSTRDVATRVGPRLGPSLAGRLSGRWHRRIAPVRITVDRRWRWQEGSPQPALFVIVENLTDRELEITEVELPSVGKAVSEYGEERLRLQPGEDRELGVSIPSPVEGPIAPRVSVEIGGRKDLRAPRTPGVPLQSHLIARSDSERAPEAGR